MRSFLSEIPLTLGAVVGALSGAATCPTGGYWTALAWIGATAVLGLLAGAAIENLARRQRRGDRG